MRPVRHSLPTRQHLRLRRVRAIRTLAGFVILSAAACRRDGAGAGGTGGSAGPIGGVGGAGLTGGAGGMSGVAGVMGMDAGGAVGGDAAPAPTLV